MAQPFAAWRITRSGSALDETGEIKQRARAFADSVSQFRGGATLLAHMDAEGDVFRYVIAPRGASALAANAAAVVGGNLSECEHLPNLDVEVLATAVVQRGKHFGIETQAGSQIDLVSEAFDRNAMPGDWIAIHLRAPSQRQRQASSEWRRQQQTHHTKDPRALLATITAGSSTFAQASSLIGVLSAAMPGFDVSIRAKRTGAGVGVWALGGIGTAVFAGGVATGQYLDASMIAALPSALFSWGSARHWPHHDAGVRAGLARGQFPSPTGTTKRATTNKQTGEITDVNYPLAPNTFMLGPDVAIGLLATAATGSTENATTRTRRTPTALLSNIGPIIGEGAHLSCESMFTGIFAVGQAGWGKSVLVRSIFGWCAMDAARELKVTGSTGVNTAMVAFENKGEGADYYQRWADIAGIDLLRMDLMDETTPAISMFSDVGTYEQRALGFAEAMREAWTANDGDGAIKNKSQETLTIIFTAALWLEANGIEPTSPLFTSYEGASVMDFARDLAHAERGEQLGRYVLAKAREQDVQRVVSALYGEGITPSRRAQDLDAPRNKIAVLSSAGEWFAKDRPRVQWDELLRQHECIVFNMGTSANGKVVSEEAERILSRMVSFLMTGAVRRVCSTWEREGQRLYIFADELSLLAGSTGDHIEWLREKGRSYGVCLIVATQALYQLPDKLQKSISNYGNIFWFAQNSTEIVGQAVNDLSLSGDEWTPSDVANLPRYHVAARLQANHTRQAPFTTKIDYFEGAPYDLHDEKKPWQIEQWFATIGLDPNTPIVRKPAQREWMKTA